MNVAVSQSLPLHGLRHALNANLPAQSSNLTDDNYTPDSPLNVKQIGYIRQGQKYSTHHKHRHATARRLIFFRNKNV